MSSSRYLWLSLVLLSVWPIARADELKIAHFMSPRHPMHQFVMAPLADKLAAASNGNFTARIYPAGELGKGPKQLYKRAVDGVADIVFGIVEYTASQFPRTNLIALPGVSDGAVQATDMLWRAKQAYLEQEFKRVKLLALWAHDHAILITKTQPVRQLSDLDGLKIRAPGTMGAEALSLWGAVPVAMPITKAYSALDTGVVDGILVGASAIKSFKLHEVGNHFTVGVPAILGAQYLIMNKARWDGLSTEQQQVLATASGQALSVSASQAYADAHAASLQLVADAGKQIVSLDAAAAQPFNDAVQPMIDKTLAALKQKSIDGVSILAAMRGQ